MEKCGLLDMMISRLPGLSYPEKIRLCESFDNESVFLQKSADEIEKIINRKLQGFWDVKDIRIMAENDAKTAKLRGINTVSWRSPVYPPLLREIYDPPVLLYFTGKLPNPEIPLVAVVGTRKPCTRAATQAYDIGKDLGNGGLSVVSGLAIGIDSMAHRGNIDGSAATVAVLGSGADEIYPSSNRPLARKILETGGAVITEYPPGTRPYKSNFPARNRIISGLSRGAVIVQAPDKSGALITARFAAEQGRDLWIASAGINSPGTERLAGDGAQVIYSAAEIFKAWKMKVPDAGNNAGKAGGLTVGKTVAGSLAKMIGVEI